MGFTVLAIEAPMPEALALNEYVLTGKGDPAKLLSGLYFWTWDTAEVLDLVRWMRQYNMDPRHSRKVKFYGVDMQFATRATKVAFGYLLGVDPAGAEELKTSLSLLMNPFTASEFDGQPAAKRDSIIAGVRSLLRKLDQHPGGKEWRIARQNARVALQFVESPGRANIPAAQDQRDAAMTENLEWILKEEGARAKVVIWAHNVHVARIPQNDIQFMGSRLSKSMGAQLVVLGFAFNRGAFQARTPPAGTLQPFAVPAAPAGSMDAVLAASGVRIGVIDLRRAPAGAVRQWLTEARGTRSIGASFSPKAAMRAVKPTLMLEAYDGLIFVDETTAARPNAGGRLPIQAPTFPAPQNLDFEAPEALSGWQSLATPNSGFLTGVTSQHKVGGKQAAFVERSAGEWPGEFYGNLSQQIVAAPYHGKRIRLSAHVRADVQEESGSGHLWLKISAASPFAVPLSLHNSADRPIRENQWKEMVIEADVPKHGDVISYGVAFIGVGRVMIDNVVISVVEP